MKFTKRNTSNIRFQQYGSLIRRRDDNSWNWNSLNFLPAKMVIHKIKLSQASNVTRYFTTFLILLHHTWLSREHHGNCWPNCHKQLRLFLQRKKKEERKRERQNSTRQQLTFLGLIKFRLASLKGFFDVFTTLTVKLVTARTFSQVINFPFLVYFSGT